MAESRRIARRSFLARAAAAAFPAIIPAAARGAGGFVAPGNRITLGFIGTGNHGVNMNLKTFLQQPDAQVVALCDVDAGRVRAAQELVAQHYAQQQPGGTVRAYFQHVQSNDLLARPGEQDLTCHVCWDWLADALRSHGFGGPTLEFQEAFFVRHAGRYLESAITADAGTLSPRKLSLMQLLHPAQMGQKFQVLHALR